MLTTELVYLPKAITVAANGEILVDFTISNKCIGVAGYSIGDRGLANKIGLTGVSVTGDHSIRIMGRNITSSSITIPTTAHVIALVVGSSSE